MLAPMAGVTDAAYRIISRRHGAELAYSEMVSVAGLAYASEKTWELVVPADEEPDIAVQLFGAKPEQFGPAVVAIQERLGSKLALIDINMACPARKVLTKGEGAALMDDPVRAAKIAAACVREAQVPITVKMRRSRLAGSVTAPDLAQRLEQEGVAAVAVHGRSATQLYTGQADWSVIDAVAERVAIPVIGTGDVLSAAAAVDMLTTTAASAVFIARGSYGNPWIFEDARALLAGQQVREHKTVDERLNALEDHLNLLHDLGGHMRKARSFCAWYLKGMPHAAEWRARSVQCETFEDFIRLVQAVRYAAKTYAHDMTV
ncbi:tRNA-dihydrouridine synthase [Collinsella sp. AGMB00827]|uniref:tRNA-dihydrouridine synthase n=2 Tax=Collinsella ureilytica TaxID=2869515 RepID=A0ABS7MKS9_9ACTN|nr:tRNA-dihydrouridine synthase [Collinsella urealyticum]